LFDVSRASLPALLHSPYSKSFHQLFYLDSSLSIIMDVAGTIIGALSFGITLCDGIVTYCHAWKDQDKEIRSLTSLCETSKQLLQDIEQRIKDKPTLDPSVVQILNATLQACTKHTEEVLRLTRSYSAGPGPSTMKLRARDLLQRLKFPFEKKTLEELRNIMVAFRGNVDTAMSVLQL
jgi:hypothetical protein